MIRDPLGGWDWDGIRQLGATLVFVCMILSLFSALNGSYWYGPYVWAGNFVADNATISIIVAMVFLMGLWLFEQFNSGYY